ncbi:glutamine synthetase [Maritimibacter sp. 55A14]|uniref:glutamine synthetase family protein n=1 Tax=Maritimibacter sp. 55A14 TaxID=2174844 RepID=UPI000D613D5D|nr:glutamine synthetase family protein [Maritimibacter sp. 55A14]PWE32031.1 glutamine synthetase [Maritimibacter sp. 55A14]
MTEQQQAWLDAHPEIKTVRIAVSDLNGQPRGKRLPVASARKALEGGARMPLSTHNVDIWGDDIEDSPLVFESGDADGMLRPTERGLVPMPWLGAPSALLPMWMYQEDGTHFPGDPRHALAAVLERYRARGWTPVVATELEFYLVDDGSERPEPPINPYSGRQVQAREVLALNGLDVFDAYFTELYEACAAMGIPADSAISESGQGQFEINLMHEADALKAADDAWLFKQTVKGLARKHEMAATFMAKPYGEHAGNGLHIHFSVLDAEGCNIFDDGTEKGSDTLRHAVAGCLSAMRDSALLFAPHKNSYRRATPNSHAPTQICWGYENRTAAIRIPGGAPAARRVEHRVAGGDTNPYMVLAGVLGAALIGIEDAAEPPAPMTGNAYDQPFEQLPFSWREAIALFEESPLMERVFGPTMVANLVVCKRQELKRFEERWTDFEFATYLETV